MAVTRLREELDAITIRLDGVLEELDDEKAVVRDKCSAEASLQEELEAMHHELEGLEGTFLLGFCLLFSYEGWAGVWIYLFLAPFFFLCFLRFVWLFIGARVGMTSRMNRSSK